MNRIIALLVASTILSGLGISTALADPDFVAEFGAGPGNWTITDNGDDENEVDSIDNVHLRGVASGQLSFDNGFGVQGDVLFRQMALEIQGYDVEQASLDGVLHLFYRDPEHFLLGGLVQLGQDSATFDGEDSGLDLHRALLAAEGQAFFDQFTLYGQLGLQNTSADGMSADGWFVTGEVRYFLTPNFKVEAHAAYDSLTIDAGSTPQELKTFSMGLGAEYRFEDLPVSVFARYDLASTEVNGGTASIDSHRALVGLKFSFGEETLQSRDRNGASLKPVEFGSIGNFFVGGKM